MSTQLFFKVFVNERLTAAVEEIVQVFERTIAKYEEEASSRQQEIERLRGLLQSKHNTGSSQTYISNDEIPPEQHQHEQEESLSVDGRDSVLPHIKEESQELWSSQEEDDQAQDFEDANRNPLHFSTQNSEIEQHLQDLLGSKNVQYVLPHSSVPSVKPLVHDERLQNGNKIQRAATCLTTSHLTHRSQTSCVTSIESMENSHLNPLTTDHHCCLCDKSFSSRQYLINHAFRMHSKETDVACAVCGKTFDSSDNLHAHLKSYKAMKVCCICGKQCKRMSALTEHMISHTGEKLHRCNVCGKGCSRKADLKVHMRKHTGEKPFGCSLCCKSFTHSSHLIKHMRSHTGERPYQCDVCGRGFQQSTHLKHHLRSHAQKL
ncbi:zinc finger protein 394-like isoform X2 [Sphaeramia orbicularis]|uniref:zinc finger protein 394-like isoform X2 n=1 Tax=Sphaeramia orbicularis TaxID=375764 RepID=UPI0011811F40|nr:zinc finger protein 394-like isoform X2 [Sphaeramia orbicularis]